MLLSLKCNLQIAFCFLDARKLQAKEKCATARRLVQCFPRGVGCARETYRKDNVVVGVSIMYFREHSCKGVQTGGGRAGEREIQYLQESQRGVRMIGPPG
jgi:hypothetical protein